MADVEWKNSDDVGWTNSDDVSWVASTGGVVGWTGKINTVTNPAKICGVAVVNISKVNEIV